MRYKAFIITILAAVLVLPFQAVSCTAPDKPNAEEPEPEPTPEPEPEPEPGPTEYIAGGLDDGCGLSFYDTPKPPLDGSTYKILFIGNSLTMDATCFLPQLLNSAGVKNIELTRTYHGAYTIQLYNNNYYNDGINSINTWKPGQLRWVGGNLPEYSPQTAAEADKYDYIVIQDYPGNSITWSWSADLESAVKGLIGKLRSSQRGSHSKLILHFPHTHGDTLTKTTVTYFNGSSEKFFRAVSPVFKHMLDDTDISDVISTGAMIQSLRTSGLNTTHDRDLTRGDAVHMDYGMIRYAAGLLIFKKLFTPLTGVDITNIPWRFREFFPCQKSEFTTPVLDANMPLLYEAIDSAIAYPWSICDFSSRSVSLDYDIDSSGPEMLDVGSEFPGAESFPVLFPLGNSANIASNQPYWLPYGIWQHGTKAFAKWYMASMPNPDICTYRVAYDNGTSISSPAVKGIWTGDYFEFRIPVENFAAGTKVKLTAPIYLRQSPVFWDFEWWDDGRWKCDHKTISSPDGQFRATASFVLDHSTNMVTEVATFAAPVRKGWLRFRLRCVDGSIISTGKSNCGKTTKPTVDTVNGVPSGAFYFYASGDDGKYLRFDIVE